MQRVTISIDDDLLGVVDRLVAEQGYPSRSEAVRDLLRAGAARGLAGADEAPCVATLSYVYDHGVRDLAQRLTGAQHARHDLGIASLHVHLDHSACLEVAVLRGPTGAVRRFSESLTSQRGVRHHSLHVVPATFDEAAHDHGDGAHPHPHSHA